MSTPRIGCFLSAVVGIGVAGTPARAGTGAAAASLVCEQAETAEWAIDGMLDDWADVRHRRAGGTAADASFDLRCVYDDQRLILAVDVRDDRLVRTTAGKEASEDHVSLTLGAGGDVLALTIFPGSERTKPKRRLGGKALPAWIAIEDTLQAKGWSTEISVELGHLDGWTRATPSLVATVAVADADSASDRAIEQTVRFTGELAFAGAASLLASFLDASGLRAGELRLDATAALDDQPGPERVVSGGTVVGLLGERYSYVALPVTSADEVRAVQVVELRGDGIANVLVELRQRTPSTAAGGDSGTRDLLIVYGVSDGVLAPVLTIELGVQRGDRRLSSTWSLVRRGRYRTLPKQQRGGDGKDLLVVADEAVGWDEDSFHDRPATDAVPILQPWDDDRHAEIHWLDGDSPERKAIAYRGGN